MIIREKGKPTRYYYYKKKLGRKKKRGPKKKKIHKERKYVPWDFKLIVTSHRKQIKYIDKFQGVEKALIALEKLAKKNEDVLFPVKYVNAHTIKEANYEYVLLKKNINGDEKPAQLRDKYGKLVVNEITNNSIWVIYDKKEMLIEETFWVYGYHPQRQRKTFKWIFENLILNKIENQYTILRVMVLYNKVIIRRDDDIEIVTCKNVNDSIRLYNQLNEYVIKEKKNKNVFFIGAVPKRGELKENLISEIINKTGWNRLKIIRKTTRP